MGGGSGYEDPFAQARRQAVLRRQLRVFLDQQRILDRLGPVQKDLLVRVVDIVDVPRGRTIVRQGEQGNRFYMIAAGSVEVTRRANPDDEQEPVARVAVLKAGSFFGAYRRPPSPPLRDLAAADRSRPCPGEVALLTDEPRNANVVSLTDVRLYVVERAAFKELFGVEGQKAIRCAQQVPLAQCSRCRSPPPPPERDTAARPGRP